MRTFISIELPEKIKNDIEKVILRLKMILTPIKLASKNNLHITLKFFGWVDDKKIDDLIKCVSGSVKGCKPFQVNLKGMGVFPEAKHPRVIWIGMSEESEKVKELADKIECDAAKEGFREEEGEFSPHLTIGRIKEKIEVDILSKFLAEHEKEDFGSFRVENVSLMKSTLRRSGPTYERIGKASLG